MAVDLDDDRHVLLVPVAVGRDALVAGRGRRSHNRTGGRGHGRGGRHPALLVPLPEVRHGRAPLGLAHQAEHVVFALTTAPRKGDFVSRSVVIRYHVTLFSPCFKVDRFDSGYLAGVDRDVLLLFLLVVGVAVVVALLDVLLLARHLDGGGGRGGGVVLGVGVFGLALGLAGTVSGYLLVFLALFFGCGGGCPPGLAWYGLS